MEIRRKGVLRILQTVCLTLMMTKVDLEFDEKWMKNSEYDQEISPSQTANRIGSWELPLSEITIRRGWGGGKRLVNKNYFAFVLLEM